ncbi:26199_t:CDS:2, partial [Racocetra persica]
SLPEAIEIEEEENIKSQIKNIWEKISSNTKEERQEVNPEANNWNHEFNKSERVASHVNKILVKLFTIYHKGKIAIIKNKMVVARHSVILVQRLSWFIVYKSESINPSRLKHMSKKEWVDQLKKLKKKN